MACTRSAARRSSSGASMAGRVGTFATTYKFSSKWAPDVSTGSEVHGRCQHPIVAGSGTGGFAGVTGRVDFKDDVATGVPVPGSPHPPVT